MIPVTGILKQKRLMLDGSMGALLSSMGYACECPELLGITNPSLIQDIHARYIDAGADIVITNSLGTTPVKLAHAGLAGRTEEITAAAVKNARIAAGNRAYVALDMGPTGEFLQPAGTLSFDEMYQTFLVVARAGAKAGADFILLETMTDIAECRIACLAARRAGLPVAASFTFEANGRTLTGGTPVCAALSLEAAGAAIVGVNCSGGPAQMLAPLTAMRKVTPLPIAIQPNAGLPTVDSAGNTSYPFTPEAMLPHMKTILAEGASLIGGCCGTTPDHIRAFRALDLSAPPEPAWDGVARVCSVREAVTLSEALSSPAEIHDIDDLYDLDGDESAVLIDLADNSPEEAAETVRDAQMATKRPLLFRCADGEVLDAALLAYPGVAYVYAGGDAGGILARYGALQL